MEFGILGPLLVRQDGAEIVMSAANERSLLSLLLLGAGHPVSVDEAADAVWEDRRPADPQAALYVLVARLRRRLGPDGGLRLRTRPAGYVFDVEDGELDLQRFTGWTEQGRVAAREQRWAEASEAFQNALGLWRGQALADVRTGQVHRDEARHLAELRLQAVHQRIEADLHLGRHEALIPELRLTVAEHPLRERFSEQLMLALYRNGQQADALSVYRDARAVLIRELGIEPGTELQELHRRILAADPALIPTPTPEGPAPDVEPAARVSRNDLPRDIGDFTGRQDELDRLLATYSADTPATMVISAIDGMAGIGKTALAVRAAHRLAPQFPDGQLFLDLHGHTPGRQPVGVDDALLRLLSAFGVADDRIPQGIDARAALWRAELAGRSVLVVLDNAASAEQIGPLLPSAPTCLVLVTSRRRLVALDDVATLSLDVLPPADAVALFTRIAGPAVVGQAAAVAEAVRLCGYLPLAIRLAAARLRHRSAWTVDHLVDRLRAQLSLSEEGGDDGQVAAAFELSYRQLGPDQQRMFRLLGLHPGSDIDALAAAALAERSPQQAETLLEDLCDEHLLLQPGLGRYTFHDLLRDHARRIVLDRREETADRAALTGLFDYYLHASSAAMDRVAPYAKDTRPMIETPAAHLPGFPDDVRALAWLDIERANLISAAGRAARDGWPVHASDLSRTLQRYLDLHAHPADALVLHTYALEATRDDPGRQAIARRYLGVLYWRWGHLDEALGHFGQALALSREIGDLAVEAAVLGGLGSVYAHMANYHESIDHYREALVRYRALEDLNGEGTVTGNLGSVFHRSGRYEEAMHEYQQALVLLRKVGARSPTATLLYSIGDLAMQTGRYDQAAEFLGEAVDLSRQTGNLRIEAAATDSLGVMHRRLGHHDQAAEHHRRALARHRDIGYQAGEAEALTYLADAERESGRPGRALDHLREALALTRDAGLRSAEIAALISLGDVRRSTGDAALAVADYSTALGLAVECDERHQQARAWEGLGYAHEDLGAAEPAREHWERALALYTDLGVPEADGLSRRLTGHA